MFNPNCVISPSGEIYECRAMEHMGTLLKATNYKSMTQQILDDDEEVISPSDWEDKLVYEIGWVKISGTRVVYGRSITKRALDAIYSVALKAKEAGCENMYLALHEEYKYAELHLVK